MTTPDPFTPSHAAAPPTYPFPPGTPDSVPEDFDAEAAKRELEQLRAAQAGQLTAEEVAEFRALREEKKARDAAAAEEAAEAAAKRQPNRHHVHLADGTVVEGSTIETHVDSGSGLVPVTAAWPKAEFVTFAPDGS
jgi:hypothetical protein